MTDGRQGHNGPDERQEESDSDVCFICLCGPNEEFGPLRAPCKCKALQSHAKCLARWQLQAAGKDEEARCRFCRQVLPDWREVFLPRDVDKVRPVMAIKFEGKVYKLRVQPGPQGLESFKKQVRELLGFDINSSFDVSFECLVPQTGEKLQLHGLDSYGAATHCGAAVAAERKQHTGRKANVPSSTISTTTSSGQSQTKQHTSLTDPLHADSTSHVLSGNAPTSSWSSQPRSLHTSEGHLDRGPESQRLHADRVRRLPGSPRRSRHNDSLLEAASESFPVAWDTTSPSTGYTCEAGDHRVMQCPNSPMLARLPGVNPSRNTGTHACVNDAPMHPDADLKPLISQEDLNYPLRYGDSTEGLSGMSNIVERPSPIRHTPSQHAHSMHSMGQTDVGNASEVQAMHDMPAIRTGVDSDDTDVVSRSDRTTDPQHTIARLSRCELSVSAQSLVSTPLASLGMEGSGAADVHGSCSAAPPQKLNGVGRRECGAPFCTTAVSGMSGMQHTATSTDTSHAHSCAFSDQQNSRGGVKQLGDELRHADKGGAPSSVLQKARNAAWRFWACGAQV